MGRQKLALRWGVSVIKLKNCIVSGGVGVSHGIIKIALLCGGSVSPDGWQDRIT